VAYGAALFAALGLTPLWLDEILQFGAQRSLSAGNLLYWAQINAGASPLPYLFQHAVVGALGFSTYAARLPAALCSIGAGALFALISERFLKRGRTAALAAFLILPLQFRYGLEARVYSQGLLCALLSLWLFLRLKDRPSPAPAALYGFSVALGLYSQPLTIFPVLAQVAAARKLWRFTLPAAAAGAIAYLPWYALQRAAQAQRAAFEPPVAFFSPHQLAALLHDLAGGGYASSIPLLILAACAIPSRDRLLWWMLPAAIAGPILMDAVFNYFFAARQLIFATPALIFLAAQGADRLRGARTGLALAAALLAVYGVSAAQRDLRLATARKDGLAATADAIVAQLGSRTCFSAVPANQQDFYVFLRPELGGRACGNQAAFAVLLVASQYTRPLDRESAKARLRAQSYRVTRITRIGSSELTLWEPPPFPAQ